MTTKTGRKYKYEKVIDFMNRHKRYNMDKVTEMMIEKGLVKSEWEARDYYRTLVRKGVALGVITSKVTRRKKGEKRNNNARIPIYANFFAGPMIKNDK